MPDSKYHFCCLVIILGLLPIALFAQNEEKGIDNVTWSSFRIRAQIDERTRIDIRPIIRHNQNVSNYLNTSIDLAINRKIGKGWYGQFLLRKWFIPNDFNRMFLWWDVGHNAYLNSLNISMNNRVRVHWALDTDGQNLADFIRIQHTITPRIKGRFRPLFSFETWIQLNDANAVRRTRTKPGLNWRISQSLNLTFMYRWENFIKTPNRRDENQYVTTLTYQM